MDLNVPTSGHSVVLILQLYLCFVPSTVTETRRGVAAKLSSFAVGTGSPLKGFLHFHGATNGGHEDKKMFVESISYGNSISEASTNKSKTLQAKKTEGAISTTRRSLQVRVRRQSAKDGWALSNGENARPRTGVVLVGALAAFEFIVSKIIWIAITGALMFLLKIMTVGRNTLKLQTMLEAKTTECFLWFLTALRFTGGFIIESDGCGKIRRLRSRKLQIWYYVVGLCHFLATFYSGIRLVQSFRLDNSIGDKAFHAFFLSCYILTVTFRFNLHTKAKEMIAFLNFCFTPKDRVLDDLGFDRSIEMTMGKGKSAEKLFRLILKSTTYFIFVQSGFIALSITKAKCSPRYLTSLLDECKNIPLVYILLLLPYEYIMWIQGWDMFIFYICVAVIWIFESMCWLFTAEFQQNRLLQNGTYSREFGRFTRLYKRLQILEIVFNDILKELFWPVEQTVMLSVVVVMYYILIKAHAALPIFVYAFLIIPTGMVHSYTFVCYHSIAVGTKISKELLSRWKQHPKWSLMKREIQACKPLQIKVGNYYSFNRCSNLIFTSLMVQIVATLLIATE